MLNIINPSFIPYKFKDRIETLESHLEEARRRLVQMENLKQEKSRLASQLVAQESVMEGLKAERKLWGQELAQQGTVEKKHMVYRNNSVIPYTHTLTLTPTSNPNP